MLKRTVTETFLLHYKPEKGNVSIGFSGTPSGTDPTGIDPCLPVVRCRPCIPDGLTFACSCITIFVFYIQYSLGVGAGHKSKLLHNSGEGCWQVQVLAYNKSLGHSPQWGPAADSQVRGIGGFVHGVESNGGAHLSIFVVP